MRPSGFCRNTTSIPFLSGSFQIVPLSGAFNASLTRPLTLAFSYRLSIWWLLVLSCVPMLHNRPTYPAGRLYGITQLFAFIIGCRIDNTIIRLAPDFAFDFSARTLYNDNRVFSPDALELVVFTTP
jgi:hypothetical protein